MKTLAYSPAQALPLNVVTEKLGWIGVTGSGKSYGAMKMAELLWHARAQFFVLDPKGDWYGLRLARDGKSVGIPVPVFGGLHGDVPLEPTAGALIADLIIDRNLSAVIDVSQFESDADKTRFATDFMARLYFRLKQRPRAIHGFLEECQEFVPQNPQRGEERMLHVFHRAQKLGRGVGLGTSLITQRPQEVSKKALNQAQTLFVFRLTGSQERDAIAKWVNEKELSKEMLDGLSKMKTGDAHLWSPAWLECFKLVRCAPRETFDASKTPEVGAQAVARELKPIDLEQLKKDLAATIEKAKAEDPKELRARVESLKRELASVMSQKSVTVVETKPARVQEKRVEVPILRGGEIDRMEKLIGRAEKLIEKANVTAQEAKDIACKVAEAVAVFKKPCICASRTPAFQRLLNKTPGHTEQQVERPLLKTMIYPHEVATSIGADTINGSQKKILAAILFFESLRQSPVDKSRVAILAGMSANGNFFNHLGALRTAGLVDYPSTGMVHLTEEGRRTAPRDGVPTTTSEMQGAVMAKLTTMQRRILEVVLARGGEELTKNGVAETLNLQPNGNFFNNLGRLHSMGVVEYPRQGYVRAAEIMFLDDEAGRN